MKIYVHFLVVVLFGPAVACGQQDASPATIVAADGVEVLTRGPVHEAFAETIVFDPEPGVVVPKEPPEAIEELPPEQKPEGANVEWIPGYWAWDDERDDFLWVSGIWRDLPPGRQWVSGYWRETARGSQWTSGYWANAQISEIEYLPEPPPSLEAGPNTVAPSANHVWVPGCWVWHQHRYAWRPGYWVTAHANWLWIPAHYVWTPCGYVFVDGYYDHSVVRRGVLFAPVVFTSRTYVRPGFHYSPVTAINLVAFTNHLFLRPTHRHYYFGDYYDPRYVSSGFAPWFAFHGSRHGYDPFYAHQRHHHRNDREWDRKVAMEFAHRREHEEARPPRTWAAQQDRGRRDATNNDRSLVITASLNELARSSETPIRWKPVTKQERQSIGQQGKEVRVARDMRQRAEAESRDAAAESPGRTSQPVKVKLPKTSIVFKTSERTGKDEAPPQTIEAPAVDLTVEPKARKTRPQDDLSPAPRTAKRQPPTELPDAEPRPDRPKAATKGPTADPRAELPGAEPKSERPRALPKGPLADPRTELPIPEPKPERPKAAPKGPEPPPRPELPAAEPKRERPKLEPNDPGEPLPPRSKGQRPKAEPPTSPDPKLTPPQPKADPPKLVPPARKAAEPQPQKSEPKNKGKQDRPKTNKGKSDDEAKANSKEEAKDKEKKKDKDKDKEDKTPR